MIGNNEDNYFTFVWKIENWRLDERNVCFSPTFGIKKFSNTRWYLKFSYRMEDNITFQCSLGRDNIPEGPTEIQVHFNIALSDNPNELTRHVNKQTETFPRGSIKNCNNLIANKHQSWLLSSEFIYIICLMSVDADAINVQDDAFIPRDLKLCLANSMLEHMQENLKWEQKKLIHYSNRCFARTIFSMEKKTIKWAMENILSCNKKEHLCFVTSHSGISLPEFSINLQVNEENTISIKIKVADEIYWMVDIFMYKVFILDSEENIVCITHKWSWSESNYWNLEFTLETKHILLEQPAFDLKTCCLCLEIGDDNMEQLSWIESTSPADFTCLNSSTDNQTIDNHRLKMKNFYSTKRFCDVTLQFPSKKFKAHKTVLCAHSPVFSAMFETDMKESKDNTVTIEDIDENTMDRVLNFLYSNTLEDNQMDDILKLYLASDKYGIRSLQDKCTMFLASNITMENALPLLRVSDAHNDQKLKLNVFKFVVEHFSNIVVSQDWRLFSKENMMLANKILEKAYIKVTGIQRN